MTSRVMVALRIDAPPSRVFEAFTSEIGRWWRSNTLFPPTADPDGELSFEPGVGGRLVTTGSDGEVVEIGEVRSWNPPDEIVFTWRPTSFSDGQVTEVSVRFESVDDSTRVVVEHAGWDTIPERHAARHGFPLLAFQQRLAGWWQDLLASLARHSSS